jgi:thymidine kinase
MFTEARTGKGWIEVICGCMFSGKTEELIRRLRRAEIAGQTVGIFKPSLEQRYDANDIVSHDAGRIPSTPVDAAADIAGFAAGMNVVGIDEAQFFDAGLVAVAEDLAAKGTRVIIAGLDMDFSAQPFGPMPQLMAGAEYITKLQAICIRCGDMANFSFRRVLADDQVLLGEKDTYEPRCRTCFAEGL